MKVKIQYTVDVDDIPEELIDLIGGAGIALEDARMSLNLASDDLRERNLIESIEKAMFNVESTRCSLSKTDVRLQDCEDILKGFLTILKQKEATALADTLAQAAEIEALPTLESLPEESNDAE